MSDYGAEKTEKVTKMANDDDNMEVLIICHFVISGGEKFVFMS